MKPPRAFAAFLPALLVGASMTLAPPPTEAASQRAVRGASAGQAARPAHPAAAPRSAPSGGGARTAARPGHAPTVAHGRATYGYGYGYGYYPGWGWWGGYPGYGYSGWGWSVGWYGPWWSFGVGWDWPYYGGYYYPGPVYYAPSMPSGTGGSARVETDVEPRDAVVKVDGEEVGFARDYNGTWDVLPVPSGRRVIEFSAKGYMTLRTILQAQSGGHYQIAYSLQRGEGPDPRSTLDPSTEVPSAAAVEPNPGDASTQAAGGGLRTGRIKFRVVPTDAAVYLDGEFLARGAELQNLHGAIPVASGAHRVEVVRPGFQSQARDIVVPEGGSLDVSMELNPAP